MQVVVLITLEDGLSFPSGFMSPADYKCVLYARVPADWVEGASLKTNKLETFFQNFYGATWRMGNEDGSQFVVRSVETRVLTPAEEQSAPWKEVSNNKEYRYWFYHVSDSGELQTVQAAEF